MDRTFTPTFSLKHHRGGDVVTVDCGGPAGEVFELVSQLECVVSAVRLGTALHADGDDGVWAVRMCEAAAAAAATGECVALDGSL